MNEWRQSCRSVPTYEAQRKRTWLTPISLQEKLCGGDTPADHPVRQKYTNLSLRKIADEEEEEEV